MQFHGCGSAALALRSPRSLIGRCEVMTSWSRAVVRLCVASAMTVAPLAISVAAEGGAPPEMMFITSSPGCPALTWAFSRNANPDGTVSVHGPIWFEDGSGMSAAAGKGTADGKFTLTVQKVRGNGPEGTITGQRYQD